MKKLLYLLLMFTTSAYSQNIMLIEKNDGTTLELMLKDLKEVRFVDKEECLPMLSEILLEEKEASIFANAIIECGLSNALKVFEDETYSPTGSYDMDIPTKRLVGHTLFMVSDKVLSEKYNIHNVKELTDYAVSRGGLYNLLSYHIVERMINDYTNLVTSNGIDKDAVNPTEFFTTLQDGHLMKIEMLTVKKGDSFATTAAATVGINGVRNDYYINRRYNNEIKVEGSHVFSNVGIKAANGAIFYCDKILEYDEVTTNTVLNTRIRIDFASLFSELSTNGIRYDSKDIMLPHGFIKDVTLNEGAKLIYKHSTDDRIALYGDEIILKGSADFEFKLPCIPFDGIWQIRLGYSANSSRSIMQAYLDGCPCGIPIDQRRDFENQFFSFINDNYLDIRNDNELRTSYRQQLWNNGFQRGPHSVYYTDLESSLSTLFTVSPKAMRIIIGNINLKASDEHTLRFRSVLDNDDCEMVFDYLELVPKTCFDTESNMDDDL